MSTADDAMHIPYSAVERHARIDDLTFHRHYRRYAETRIFVNRIPPELLLLRVGGVPVVIGLETQKDLEAIEAVLAGASDAVHASSWMDVA